MTSPISGFISPHFVGETPLNTIAMPKAINAHLPGIDTLGLDHLGIAVRSLTEARSFYESLLGASWLGVEEVTEQQVRVAFLRLGNEQGVTIELLEPTSPESPIAKFLDKRGPGIHHVAFAVRDLPLQLAKLKLQQVRLIDTTPRLGAHGKSIAFVHPAGTGGVLVELCEAPLETTT